jgi:U4/U6.U5 tri-snRNP-associated protein 1
MAKGNARTAEAFKLVAPVAAPVHTFLAKGMKDDEKAVNMDLEGTTVSTVSVGRGLSNVLSMLRRTGEITGKTAGKEELRGRAKDKRTYKDYEAFDLSKVVKVGKNATDKDKEFANREIKLEYRDDHGRLLTRNEAYHQLCYQFHGHGSGKRNEERRLHQIAREQAEARVASRQVGDDTGAPTGVMGALKATQTATGKAFVVHKT